VGPGRVILAHHPHEGKPGFLIWLGYGCLSQLGHRFLVGMSVRGTHRDAAMKSAVQQALPSSNAPPPMRGTSREIGQVLKGSGKNQRAIGSALEPRDD
jgi:hypothetical protein